MNLKNKSFPNIILCSFLFLASLNLASRFFVFVFLAFFCLIISIKELKMNDHSMLYLLLGVVMIGYHYEDGILSMLKCLSYAFFYLIGYNLVQASYNIEVGREENRKEIVKSAYRILIIVSIGSFVHYILNYVYNLGQDVGRNTNDIWTGEALAATGQGALSCLAVGLAVALIIAARKKSGRICGAGMLLSIMAYNLVLGGRTLIFIFVLVSILGIVFYSINLQSLKGRLNVIVVIAGLVVATMLFYVFNVFGVRTIVESSNLYLRFKGGSEDMLLESGRGNRKISFLKNMAKFPFGGLNLRNEFGYAHDLLLDGYDQYGVIVLILLIVILCLGAKELMTFCQNKENEMIYRMSFLCIYVSVLLEFCVEPIFDGMPWLFACYCLINGCLAGGNRAFHLTDQ